MNKFVKYTLIAIGSNIASFVIFSIPLFNCQGENCLGTFIIILFLIGISLLVQLIVGLSFLANERKQLIGQAMLLTVGIFLLIGFSICSIK